MNISLLHLYEYLNWRRRVALLKMLMLLEAKQASISHIHSYIVTGNDPRTNPDLSADYYSLVDEYGENLFQAELFSYLGDAALIKEEDKDPQQ